MKFQCGNFVCLQAWRLTAIGDEDGRCETECPGVSRAGETNSIDTFRGLDSYQMRESQVSTTTPATTPATPTKSEFISGSKIQNLTELTLRVFQVSRCASMSIKGWGRSRANYGRGTLGGSPCGDYLTIRARGFRSSQAIALRQQSPDPAAC